MALNRDMQRVRETSTSCRHMALIGAGVTLLLALCACAGVSPAPAQEHTLSNRPSLTARTAQAPSGIPNRSHISQEAFDQATPTTFRELLRRIRVRSPLLAAARSRTAAFEATADARRAEKYGEITPLAQVFQYDSDRLVAPISSPSSIGPRLFSDQQYGIGLEGRLALDISGRIGEVTRGARSRAQAAEKEAESLALELDDQASILYRGLQALEGTREALLIERDALDEHVRIAQKSVEVGRLEAVEVLRLQAAHDAVVGDLAGLDAREAGLRSSLAALLHQDAFNNPAPPPAREPGPPTDLPLDLARHPAVRALTLRAEGAGHVARAAGDTRRPDLDLVGAVRWNDGIDADGDTTAEIGLRISWPAYDGGRRSSTERSARHEEQAARLELAGLLDRTRAQVAASEAAWGAAANTLRAARSGHAAAREAARVQRSRFEAGRLSSTDLLDAESRLAEASDALSRALVGWWRADDALYLAHGLVPRGEAPAK